MGMDEIVDELISNLKVIIIENFQKEMNTKINQERWRISQSNHKIIKINILNVMVKVIDHLLVVPTTI